MPVDSKRTIYRQIWLIIIISIVILMTIQFFTNQRLSKSSIDSHRRSSIVPIILEKETSVSTAPLTTDLNAYLKQYKNRTDKDILLIINPGNAGDMLIDYGMILLFNDINIKYQFGKRSKQYTNSILFYSGGGNFIGIYGHARKFIKLNMNLTLQNEIILLPHTIKDE
eukprot:342283_1